MGGPDKQPAQGRNGERPKELEAVRTTIVGGRPPGSGRDWGEIPRGIEVLVKKASIDPEFKSLLLDKRAGAAADIDLSLERAEVAILNHVPRVQLETIIARTHVDVESRGAFLGRAAAVMLAALGVGPLAAAEVDKPAKAKTADSPATDIAQQAPKKATKPSDDKSTADKTAQPPQGEKSPQPSKPAAGKKRKPTARQLAPKKLERPKQTDPADGIRPPSAAGIRPPSFGIEPEPTGVRRWRHYK